MVPRAPTINGVTVTHMFHSFFNSLAKFTYLLLISLSFIFSLWSARISKSKLLASAIEGNPKVLFSIATTLRCWEGRYSFPGLLQFIIDPYLIMLRVKQVNIKYHFLSL